MPLVALGLTVAALFTFFFGVIPLPDQLGVHTTVIADADGREIATLSPQTGQRGLSLSDVPPHLPQAVLAAEDAEFYDHLGVSFGGAARAFMVNALEGRITQGGSTISQQYVKTATADTEVSFLRKLREAALAIKLERQHSKDQILEFYLNTIYFGRGAYGVEAAAQAYFGKPASELTREESVLLTAMIPAPSALDPAENPERVAQRYARVVERLWVTGRITEEQVGALSGSMPEVIPRQQLTSGAYGYFMDAVRADLVRILGEDNLYRGYQVTTTLDPALQQQAEEAYAHAFDGVAATGALVAVDPADGGIRAVVGGKDRMADEFNLALRATRQPGSTFKTFALAAFISDGYSTETPFQAPATYTYEPCRDPAGNCTVRNYEDAEYPNLTLREATYRSVNTVYAQLSQQVGNTDLIALAEAAGIRPGRLDPAIDSLVLGSQGVTPLEMAEAYNTFPAAGVHRRATAVSEVRDANGEVIYRANLDGERAFSEGVAWEVTDVLQGVITDGTAESADIGRPAAGKTGTTSNHADAWFAGYTPELTAVVWMGNRDGNATLEGEPTGGDLPAELWADFMRRAHLGIQPRGFPPAPGGLEVYNPLQLEVGATAEPDPGCGPGEDVVTDEAGTVCVPLPTAEPDPPPPAPDPEPTAQPTAVPPPAPVDPTEPDPAQLEPSPAPPPPEPTPSPTPAPGATTASASP